MPSDNKINFVVSELENVIEKEIINITDLNDPRQLLSCIPNHNQLWTTWITIGMCLHKLGEQYRQNWIDWSIQSQKGTTQACVTQWKTFDRTKPKAVGLSRLRTIALHYQPQNRKLFSSDRSAISDLVDLQPAGVFEETYNQQYVKPYPFQNYTTIIEQSQMGTGKTYQAMETIKWLLGNNPKARILFMSARKAFAVSMSNDINRDTGANLQLYFKVKEDICQVSQLMIQMESIHKLEGAKPYDLVILDESESCLKQFSSTTMKKLPEVVNVFHKIVSKCQYLLICDAFLSNRSLVLCQLRNLNRIIVRTNQYVSKPRQVVMLKKKQHLVSTLVQKLKQGSKCFFVSASKTLIKEIIEEYGNQFKILAYHADQDDKHSETLENVNHTWSQYDLVITSATITVGINFDTNYFDYCFLYGSSYGATPRDLLQAHMRVRNLNKCIIYCHIYATLCPVKRTECKLQDVIDHSEILYKAQLAFAEYKQETPTWLKQIMLLSQLEDNLSGQKVLALYKHYFQVLGYSLCEEGLIEDELVEISQKDHLINYDQIEDINSDEAELLREAVKFGESTFLDRNKLLKHEFNQCIKTLAEKRMTRQIFYDRYFQDPTERLKFFHLAKEVKLLSMESEMEDISYADLQISRNLIQSIVKGVISQLGLKHSQDLETMIKEEYVAKIKDKLPQLEQQVKTLIPSTHKIKEQSDDPLRLINRLLTQHGFTICRKKRNRRRINGKRVSEPFYQLEPINNTYNDPFSPLVLFDSMKKSDLPKGKSLL